VRPFDLEGLVRALIRDELAMQPKPPPAPPVDGETLITRAGVARHLGTTPAAVDQKFYRARKRGEVHPLEAMVVYVDGVRRWRKADVVAYVNALRERAVRR
jgi:hypothetical protein